MKVNGVVQRKLALLDVQVVIRLYRDQIDQWNADKGTAFTD